MGILGLLRYGLPFTALVFIASCGGGSGGTSASSSQPSDSAQAQSSIDTSLSLPVGKATSEISLAMALGMSEILYGLAEFSINELFVQPGYYPVNNPPGCGSGGTYRVTLSDRDGNAWPSSGDSLRVELNQCKWQFLDAAYTGAFNILITRMDVDPKNHVIQLTLDMASGIHTPPPLIGRLAGQVQVLSESSPSGRSLKLMVPGSFEVQSSDWIDFTRILTLYDTLSAATITKSWDVGTTEVALEMDAKLTGDSLQNRIAKVKTSAPLVAQIMQLPHKGEVQVLGAAGQISSFWPDQGANALRFQHRYPSGGGTSLSSSPLWSDMIEGSLWQSGNTLQVLDNTGGSTFFALKNVPRPARPFELAWHACMSAYCKPGHTDPYAFQFTKAIRSVNATRAQFVRIGNTRFNGLVWSEPTIDATVEVQGSRLVLSPASKVAPQVAYELRWQTPTGNLEVVSVTGEQISIPTRYIQYQNPFVAIEPTPVAGNLPILTNGAGALFTATTSSSDPPGGQFRWTQISGPQVLFESPTSAQTRIVLAAPASSNGLVRVRVEMTNARGLFDLSEY